MTRTTRDAWPRGRWAILVPLALFLLLMFAYEAVRDLVAPSPAPALANARDVVEFERGLGTFWEGGIHEWVQGSAVLEFLTTWYYTIAYTGGFIVFFVWLWLRRRDRFWFVFAWYWVTSAVAVMGYWLYPLAPPRLAGLGLEDPTKAALELGGAMSWFQPFRNEFAAMPSMHVGQAVFYAVALTFLLTSPWRWLWWLWPAAMQFAVIATANHYWVDGVVGGACVLAALGITVLAARPLGLRRPWDAAEPAPRPAIEAAPA